LTRLATAIAITPSIRPAIIDSHGKPGIAGSTIGVDTELVEELVVAVVVLATVKVDTAVLTTVVVTELIVVEGIVVALDDVTLELVIDVDALVVTGDELEVVSATEVEVVPPLVTVGGTTGSRWKIPVRAVVTVVAVAHDVPVLGCWPTAQPSVGLVVKTEYNAKPHETGSVSVFV
jgi:hypothetical protein